MDEQAQELRDTIDDLRADLAELPTKPRRARDVFARIVAIALGLVSSPVPGATPKNPASGLIA